MRFGKKSNDWEQSSARVLSDVMIASLASGCHAGGGNIVQAGQTLFTGDLQKNGMMDPDALYNLIYKGKGKMPGYGTDCAPRVRPALPTLVEIPKHSNAHRSVP